MRKEIAVAFTTAGFLALAGTALAEANGGEDRKGFPQADRPMTIMASSTIPGSVSPTQKAQPMVLQVEPNGKVLLRGSIDAVSGNTLTVKGWGGEWTINVSSSTQVLPESATLASFSVGDFVGVQGTVNQVANWTIDAVIVRDRSKVPAPQPKVSTKEVRDGQKMASSTPRGPEGINDKNEFRPRPRPEQGGMMGSTTQGTPLNGGQR